MALIGIVVAAALSQGAALPQATFQPAPCGLEMEQGAKPPAGVECGWIAVPRDATAPDAGTLRLWTARIRATGAAHEDPVVYINGGPGIATVDSIVPHIEQIGWLTELRRERDIILFDQRGTGRSEQALCPDLGRQLEALSGEGLSPALEEERGRALFAACKAALVAAGIRVEDYTTAAITADLDAVRQGLGVERWNLIGVSYGTLVALHAMRVQPQTVRSALLASPFPPNSVTWAEQASSAAAGYQAIDRACAAEAACHARFGALVPKLEATFARLDEAPLQDGERRITGSLFAKGLWPLAVRSSTVGFVPLAIDRAYAGDAEAIRGLVRTYAGGDSFGGFSPAQTYAIACHEAGRTRDWYARARNLYPALVPAAPDDSMDRLCAEYRPGHARPEFFAPVASDIPVLVYAGSLDLATPAVDAYQTVRFLPNATIVEVAGAAHVPVGVDDCTRGIAVAFMADPVKAPDLSCLATRTPAAFAQEGLEKLFAPMEAR